MRSTLQTELDFPVVHSWGGRREGAGRRRRRGGVAHAKREAVSQHDPRLVTLKCVAGLPSLRTRRFARVIACSIAGAHKRRFRVVHYSIQSNHIHLIVEAMDAAALTGGMRGLVSRIAKGLNKLWERRGGVFASRFHDVVLRSLRQVRNALRYVLNNHLKHGARRGRPGEFVEPDRYSSADYFDGWADRAYEFSAGVPGCRGRRSRWAGGS
jgi:REP-associated tyrosine transposase